MYLIKYIYFINFYFYIILDACNKIDREYFTGLLSRLLLLKKKRQHRDNAGKLQSRYAIGRRTSCFAFPVDRADAPRACTWRH